MKLVPALFEKKKKILSSVTVQIKAVKNCFSTTVFLKFKLGLPKVIIFNQIRIPSTSFFAVVHVLQNISGYTGDLTC